jgi:hypothetical protein
MGESDSESKTKFHIPFFFYDVIGRMMPGAYLIFGTVLCLLPFFNRCQFFSFVQASRALDVSGGLAAVVIGTGLLFFGFASSFLGFVLAAISHTVVEQFLWRWAPLDHSGLIEFLGIKNEDPLWERFRNQFGAEPTEKLNRSSFLCSYYTWRTSTTLGEMQGRHDSDLLAAQSFVLISLALTVAVLLEIQWIGASTYLGVWLGTLAVILLGSALAFNYHRKKRVYDRFGLFLALTDPLPKEVSQPATTDQTGKNSG